MSDKLKTGTLTFHASYNFGSMLQAYALQQTLIDLGYANTIINLRTASQKGLYRRFSIRDSKGPKNFAHRALVRARYGRDLDLQYRRFGAFMENRMLLGPELSCEEEVRDAVCSFDALIAGSDQVWNPRCTDFDMSYFLPFQEVRKVAYAPSFGPLSSPAFPEGCRGMFSDLISDFDSLSVREEESAGLVESLCGRKPAVMPDPSMLLSPAQWDSITSAEPLVRGRYLFLYSPHKYGGAFSQAAESLARTHSLKIVVCNYGKLGFDLPSGAECHMDAGPEEFLNLVKNATLVLGSSFHAVAFSLIFKRPFLAFEGEKDSRIRNVLSIFGMEDRTLSLDTLAVRGASALDFDGSRIDGMLESQAALGRSYLKTSLGDA